MRTGTADALPVLPGGVVPHEFERGGGSRKQVTIVLLTHNCAGWIVDTLERLRALDAPVVAVDNGSTDETVALLRRESLVKVIALPENIGAAARNVGLAECLTPYVAFCDDDVWYEPGGLDRAKRVFDAHKDVALVNAQVLVGRANSLDPESVQMQTSPVPDLDGIPGRPLLDFIAGASIVRRSAFRQVGGFDKHAFIGREEEDLALRLAQHNWKMQYLSEIKVHHAPHSGDVRRFRRWDTRNTLLTAWRHRHLGSALRWTWKVARTSPSRWQFVLGFLMALLMVPRVVCHRQLVSGELGRRLDQLDRHRKLVRHGQRHYVWRRRG